MFCDCITDVSNDYSEVIATLGSWLDGRQRAAADTYISLYSYIYLKSNPSATNKKHISTSLLSS